MSDFSVVESLIKLIRERQESLESVLLEGGVADFMEFKVIRARLNELARLQQEIKDLLQKRIQNESTTST